MSFILDALRKSENERQQSEVPSISDVPAVVHNTRLPTWAVASIAALSASILLLGWAWWHSTDVGQVRVANVGSSGLQPQTQTASRAANSGAVRNLAGEAIPAASPASQRAAASPVTRPVAETSRMVIGAPTMMELIVAGTILPDLALELHVYSPAASERFVRINSASYREGEILADGPRVLSITAEGVILDYRDQSFLLSAD
jgi:general secretion pathway protein B